MKTGTFQSKIHIIFFSLLTLLVMLGGLMGQAPVTSATTGFVTRSGAEFSLNGQPFYYGGTNNYYLLYQPQADVDNVLNDAATYNFRVVRAWGFLDFDSITGGPNGVTLQYWGGTAPAYNDGPAGFQKMDYMIYKAGLNNLRLIIALTNNWDAFGGMAWYAKHAGVTHNQFYSNATVIQWYKNYIAHVLNRVNSYNGLAYKNDPAIMMWELANEPRCSAADCPNGTIVTNWASDISAYIKSIDSNHLVGSGSEGFYCGLTGSWTVNCNDGVDESAIARLSTIDAESAHLYPDHWNVSEDWGTTYWIPLHINDANAAGKPFYLGEFGSSRAKTTAYPAWTDAMYNGGGDGWNFWVLFHQPFQDKRGNFVIYCPSTDCTLLSNEAAQMNAKGSTGPTPTPAGPTATPTRTNTPVPPTVTNTPGGPTNTPVPPTNTPTRTNTPVPPTATPTSGPSATPGSANLALNKVTTVSSTENAATEGGDKAVDGNVATRWRTAKNSNLTTEWITVDLGSNQTFSRVVLNWGANHATTYSVRVSTDNTNWTTVFSTTNSPGGIETINFSLQTARYVQMTSSAWVSNVEHLWLLEFEVY